MLLPLVSDLDAPLEVSCLAALALGHTFVGTCHGDITSTILQTLLERDFAQLANKFIKFMALGLGLLYMGKTEQVEDVLETIDAIEHPISKTLKVLVNICAYAGTGNVLQIQALLQMCAAKPKDQLDEEKKLEQSEEDQQKNEEKRNTRTRVKVMLKWKMLKMVTKLKKVSRRNLKPMQLRQPRMKIKKNLTTMKLKK